MSLAAQNALLFFDHIPEKIQGCRSRLTEHSNIPSIVHDERGDFFPLSASFDFPIATDLFQQSNKLVAVLTFAPRLEALLLLASIVKAAFK